MKLTWKERLFSLKNVSCTHQQLCILGVRVKRRRPIRDRKLYHHLPIQPNKIVFLSGISGYCCNPRYIAEEIIRRKLPYDLVWVVDRHVLKYMEAFPPNMRLVMGGNEEALRELATARMWVNNVWMIKYLEAGLFKRKGQTYLQTWHGSLGFKKLNWKDSYPKRAARKLITEDMKQFDYMLSNATWESHIFREAFCTNAKIMEIGHARNDIFFLPKEDSTTLSQSIRGKIGVPTWSKEQRNLIRFEDYTSITEAFEKRFGGEWLIAARWHPAHAAHMRTKFLPEESTVLNVSDYPDVQELLLAADAVITDYSSCILDFLFTGRPGFLYAPDRGQYEKSRGLYYPLEQSPFPVAEHVEALTLNIKDFDEERFHQRSREFLQKMGCMEDGHAAERAVNLIEHIISEK